MKKSKAFNLKYYKLFGFLSKVAARALYPIKTVGEQKIDKPALILANHVSVFDFMFVADAFYPQPFNIVVAEKMENSAANSFYLNKMGCIKRAQFTSDAASIMRMKKDMAAGASIMMCPEGRITASGETGYVPPSTAKLIKWLKCDVIFVKISGAFASNPSWGGGGRKRLPLTVDISRRLTAEQLAKMDNSAVSEAVAEALYNNDFDYLEKINYTKKRKKFAEGIQTLLYRCPHCGNEFKMTSKGTEFRCEACNGKFKLSSDGKIDGAPEHSNRIDKWMLGQKEAIRQQIEEKTFGYVGKIKMFCLKTDGYGYENVGEGTLTITESGTEITGLKYGEDYRVLFDAERLPVVSYGAGRFVDFYDGKPLRIVPENPAECTKIGLCIEELHKTKSND